MATNRIFEILRNHHHRTSSLLRAAEHLKTVVEPSETISSEDKENFAKWHDQVLRMAGMVNLAYKCVGAALGRTSIREGMDLLDKTHGIISALENPVNNAVWMAEMNKANEAQQENDRPSTDS